MKLFTTSIRARLITPFLLLALVFAFHQYSNLGERTTKRKFPNPKTEELMKYHYIGYSTFTIMDDTLKGKKAFPCERFLKMVSAAAYPAANAVFKHYGKNPTCLMNFTSQFAYKPHAVQLHLDMGPCRRGSGCASRPVPFRGYQTDRLNRVLEKPTAKEAKILDQWITELISLGYQISNDNTLIVISLSVEDNFTDKAYYNLVKRVKSQWDGPISRNPVGGRGQGSGTTNGVDIIEAHGKREFGKAYAGRCIYNSDGHTMRVPGVKYKDTFEDDASRQLSQSKVKDLIEANYRCLIFFPWQEFSQGYSYEKKWSIQDKDRVYIISDADIKYMRSLMRLHNKLNQYVVQ